MRPLFLLASSLSVAGSRLGAVRQRRARLRSRLAGFVLDGTGFGTTGPDRALASALRAAVCCITMMACPLISHGAQPGRPAQPAKRTPDILFAPTRQVVADAMLRLARVRPDDVVYDLGSGDGRIVILAAQKYGARGVGVEIDRRLLEISRQVAREGEVAHRVTFIEGDLFAANISEATVVTLYLSPVVNRQLESKLRRELRPGTRIISHQFPIGTWMPDEVVRAEDGTDLFRWTVPAR